MVAKVGDTITVDGKDYVAGDDGIWHVVTQASAASTPSIVRSPGRAGKEQLVRGAAGFAGSILDAGQYVGNEMFAKTQAMQRRLGLNAPSPTPYSGPSYRDRFVNATGIGPPNDFSGKVGESVGASLPMTLATAGMAPAGSAMMALKDNLIRDVAGSIASRYAEKQGASPIGQAVAGIAASILTPTSFPSRAASASAGAADVVADAAPGRVASSGTAGTRQLTDSEALKIAKQFKMKPDNVRAVAEYLRERISIDPATGKPKVDEFVAAIDEAERLFGGGVKPLLANAIGDVGGANVIAVQKSVLDENAIANSRATGIRDAIVSDLRQRIHRLVPRWETESARADHATLEQSRLLAKTEAWDNTPLDEIATRPSAGIKATLDGIKAKEALLYAKFPQETRRFIEGLGEDMSLRDLQSLRADLGNIIEAGREFGVDPKYRTVLPAAITLLKRVDGEIDAMPKEGTAKYRSAVKATADYYELFDPKYKTTRAFTLYGDKEKIVSEVFKARNPVDEIDNIRRVFDQVPDGMDKVRSIFMRELIGETLGDKPVSSVLRELNKEGKSAFYRELLGPETYRETLDILNGYRIGTAFDIGAANSALKTGSKGASLKRLAAIISSPIKSAKGIPDAITSRIDVADARERVQLIEEMIFDTKLAKTLARIPTSDSSQKEVSRWLTSFETLSARAKARSALSGRSGFGPPMPDRIPAAARQAISSGVVNSENGGVR